MAASVPTTALLRPGSDAECSAETPPPVRPRRGCRGWLGRPPGLPAGPRLCQLGVLRGSWGSSCLSPPPLECRCDGRPAQPVPQRWACHWLCPGLTMPSPLVSPSFASPQLSESTAERGTQVCEPESPHQSQASRSPAGPWPACLSGPRRAIPGAGSRLPSEGSGQGGGPGPRRFGQEGSRWVTPPPRGRTGDRHLCMCGGTMPGPPPREAGCCCHFTGG